jgi:predicted nucleic acid-binding Zn ribbon protein
VTRGETNRPELLKDALNRQIQRLGIGRRLAGGRVLACFDEWVGPQIAAKAHAESLVEGTLTVVVPDAAWRQELVMQKEQLKERLNAAAGEKVIGEIFFVAVSRRKD